MSKQVTYPKGEFTIRELHEKNKSNITYVGLSLRVKRDVKSGALGTVGERKVAGSRGRPAVIYSVLKPVEKPVKAKKVKKAKAEKVEAKAQVQQPEQ